MAHGGKREGAGRTPGTQNRLTQEASKAAKASGITPLDYMLSILRDELMSTESRFEAAKAAAPYVHAKLASVEHGGKGGGPMVLEIIRFADTQAP